MKLIVITVLKKSSYGKTDISLDYYADPNEEVIKPPDAYLEAPHARLTTLPGRLRQGC